MGLSLSLTRLNLSPKPETYLRKWEISSPPVRWRNGASLLVTNFSAFSQKALASARHGDSCLRSGLITSERYMAVKGGVPTAARSCHRYRGTSLIRNRPTSAPYSRLMSRTLW